MHEEERKRRLASFAVAIEQTLPVSDRDALFAVLVETSYLVALADTEADDAERSIIDEAIIILSRQMIVEAGVEELIHEACERIGAKGHVARARTLGAVLQGLGQAGLGLYVAALVALASHGLDRREVTMLRRIGAAAGIDDPTIAYVVKRARDAMASKTARQRAKKPRPR